MNYKIADIKDLIQMGKSNGLSFNINNSIKQNLKGNLLNLINGNIKDNFNEKKEIQSHNLSYEDVLFLIKGGVLVIDKQDMYIIRDIGYNEILSFL